MHHRFAGLDRAGYRWRKTPIGFMRICAVGHSNGCRSTRTRSVPGYAHFLLLCSSKTCNPATMSQPLERALDSYFHELVILLGCLAANLDLLSYLVKGVLSGEDAGLTKQDDEFADDLSNVMCRAALEIMDTLGVLQEYIPALNQDQKARLISYSQSYEDLRQRWHAVVEGVNDIWKLDKPPH